MALHDKLFPDLVGAIRGTPGIKPLKNPRGSVNYRFMGKGADYIVNPSGASLLAFVGLLDNEEETGQGSLRGDGGVACEQGSPAMHFSFKQAAVAGVWRAALRRGDLGLAAVCRRSVLREVGLCLPFEWKGKYYLPAPRVKSEGDVKPTQKAMRPWDGYRDVFMALALGKRVNRKAEYWAEDQSIAVATFRDILRENPGILPSVVKMPKLYLPIRQEHDPISGGWLAWIERTPEAEQAMGSQGCNWVRCAPGSIKFGYDWAELPA